MSVIHPSQAARRRLAAGVALCLGAAIGGAGLALGSAAVGAATATPTATPATSGTSGTNTTSAATPAKPAPAGGAQAPVGAALATVTILDGGALLMRGASGFAVAEGLRLQALDILETPADARLLRLEFADGRALSLGPGSRLLLDPRFTGERRSARAYLLRGWARVDTASGPAGAAPTPTPTPATTTGTSTANDPALLASPAVDLLRASASVLLRVDDKGLQVFVEAGNATVQERQRGAMLGTPLTLKPGEFLARAGDAKSAVATRPAPGFVQDMPRSFTDLLPARAALFKDRRVEPKNPSEIRYADARDWLAAEPSLRRAPGMVARWRPLTNQAAFRDALVDNMPAHPEWDRVLFPEKYRPKPSPAVEGAGTPPAYR